MFGAAIQKYGWDNFEHIVLHTELTKDEAVWLEKFYIRKLDAMNPRHGYNRTEGGECSFESSADERFVWIMVDAIEELFDLMPSGDVMRLMYLATFCNYNGTIADEAGRVLDRKQIKKKMQMRDTAFSVFWKNVTESGIVNVGDDKSVHLSPKYIYKGTLKTDARACRAYCKVVREIFRSATSNSLKKAANLFRMIPYINIEHNYLCSNPCEGDKEKIERMRYSELSEKIHYDNYWRLIDYFLEIHTSVGPAVIEHKGHQLIVNPHLFYGGSNPQMAREHFNELAN